MNNIKNFVTINGTIRVRQVENGSTNTVTLAMGLKKLFPSIDIEDLYYSFFGSFMPMSWRICFSL